VGRQDLQDSVVDRQAPRHALAPARFPIETRQRDPFLAKPEQRLAYTAGGGELLEDAFSRRHPLGQETPRPIGELTAKPAAAVHRPLVARDGQRLADERMPVVVDSDRAWKLRSM